MSYDPMTLLTFEQMDELIEWYGNPEKGTELVLKNQTISAGVLRITVDHEGVWIDAAPE